MSVHLHALTRRSTRQYLSGELDLAAGRRLFGQLARCPACSAQCEQLFATEAAMSAKTAHGVPLLALQRVEKAVLEGTVDAEPASMAEPTPRVRRWIPIGALATGLATAAALLLLFVHTSTDDDRVKIGEFSATELRPRGPAVSSSADVGLRLFRVQSATEFVERTKLGIDDVVTFSYTNTDKNISYLTLVGVQPSGQLRWYYPSYGEDTSVAIRPDVVDEPLGDGFDLSVNHSPGNLLVIGIFSAEPIAVDKLKLAIEAVVPDDGIIDKLPLLDIPQHAVQQHLVLVEIVELIDDRRVK